MRLKPSSSLSALILVSCVCGFGTTGTQAHKAKAPPLAPADSAPQTNGPGADFPVTLGEQYSVGNTVYTPADVMNYDAVGYVAVDGEGTGISAAHHTLPIPSYVEVTSLKSGRTILVRVDRRGPMDSNRVIALSPGAAEQLGLADHDTVRVRRVNPPEPERAVLRAGGAAPERMPTPAPLLAVLTRRLGPDEPVSLTSNAQAPGAVRPMSGGAAIPAQMVAPAPQPAPAPAYAPSPDLVAAPPSETAMPEPKAKRRRSGSATSMAPPAPTLAPDYAPPARAYSQPAAQYAPQAQTYAAPRYAVAPAPAAVPQYAPAPVPSAPLSQPQAAPPEPAPPAPVPFHSYLIQPLRRAPDGTILLPGTNTPTYASPPPYNNAPTYAPTYSGQNYATPAYSRPAYPRPTSPHNDDLAGEPSAGASYTTRQGAAASAAPTRPAEPFHSYLIRPLSRSTLPVETTSLSEPSHANHTRAKGKRAEKPHQKPSAIHRKAMKKREDSSEESSADTSADTAMESPSKATPHHAPHKHPAKLPDDTTPPAYASQAAYSPPAAATAPLAGGGMLVVQAGAFSVRGRAEEVAAKVGGQVSMSGRMWRVRSGPFTSRAEAEAALAKAKAAGYSGARIQRAD